MPDIEVFTLGWFALIAILHFGLAVRLIPVFLRTSHQKTEIDTWPSVMAIIVLRGGDELLEETLRCLLSQDYPDYHLRIILDSETDPATPFVQNALRDSKMKNVEVMVLPERKSTCSGKNSGILHGSENLPSNCEIAAIFDGDAVLHPSCFKELVAPLMEGSDFTNGNRWYSPDPTVASLLRYLWNGLAITVMNALHIPWGGCMAMKREVIEHPELRRRLSIAFGDDSTFSSFLLQEGKQIQFIPEATIVNDDHCSFSGFYNFLVRQYLTVRVNNPRWPFLFWSNVLLGMTAGIAFPCVIFNFNNLRLLMSVGCALVIGAIIFEVAVGSTLVRRQKRIAGGGLDRLGVLHWLKLPLALLILCFANFAATLHAALIYQHQWRGITYRFPGRKKCEIIEVQPLGPVDTPANVTPAITEETVPST